MNRYEKATSIRVSYVPSKTRLFSVHLRCGGKIHKIVFRYHGPVCLWSHRYDDPKKLALAAQLGRPLPLCFEILEAIKGKKRPFHFPGPAIHRQKFALVAFSYRVYYQNYVDSYIKNKQLRERYKPPVPPVVSSLETERGY